MEKPIIGILGNTYKTQPGLFSSAERMYVNSDYIESVLNNGGIPMARSEERRVGKECRL